ncbi:hypothetical protein B0H16DRAFT_1458793 [Mycena metata]|uniref:Uncharacterized protein n=1 Tax=Mycena metata TaxID=1033252 RepID=A0AAD7NCQ7_9AGAR|nr:hypothetical protein B0H16DRAFT_1458789 [Mycena metata]KAJ7755254.1 hypothetical protein B0H16DRAFT_1458793 [Mycena metata]
MNPPNLPPPAPPARNPDPTIQLAHSCSKCAGPLGELRVHEGTGTTGPKSRGKLSQSLARPIPADLVLARSGSKKGSNLNRTELNAAFRFKVRPVLEPNATFRFGVRAFDGLNRTPNRKTLFTHYADSWNAPLRFAPPPPPEPPEGTIPCPGGCLTKDGNPRKASRQCIGFKCKGCCTEATAAVTQTGAYCGNPGAPAAPVTPVPAQQPPAPPQFQYLPAPQLQYAPPQYPPPHFVPQPAAHYPPPTHLQPPATRARAGPLRVMETLVDSTAFGLGYHSDVSDRDRCAGSG